MSTSAPGPVNTGGSPNAKLRTLPFAAVSINGGFWDARQKKNREASLPHGYKMLKNCGTHDNFVFAAGKGSGEWKGHPSRDSDLYKWLEAAAYVLAAHPDDAIRSAVEESIGLIEKVQAEDGYLHTYFLYKEPNKRWTDIEWAHELYMAGHFIQAAVAFSRLHGDDRLLNVSRRLADHIDSVFGPGKMGKVPGHPEIEMALVELYRETGKKRYLNLANHFVDLRGHKTLKITWYGSWYYPDHVPVRDAEKIEGHAVRALYLTSGVADAYLETGDDSLLNALKRQWLEMTSRKTYVTGGLGSRHDGEAFGAEYELPNDRAYCETCAAVAGMMWSWRMLLATGEARFADSIERALYNGFLSGVALDGTKFFYTNPLLSIEGMERQEWYPTACCPPNIMRMIGSLQHYLATHDESGIQIHQYASSRIDATAGQEPVTLSMKTEYPWKGLVSIHVDETPASPWQLTLRVPSWCTAPELKLNGRASSIELEHGYVLIERTWQKGDIVELDLTMEPRLTVSHPLVETNRNRVAIERGPIVYCFEQADYEEDLNVLDTAIDISSELKPDTRKDLLGGIVTIEVGGFASDLGDWNNALYRLSVSKPERRPVTLRAIPYFAWANRGKGPMRIWTPVA